MTQTFDLQRFVDAQADQYPFVLQELRAGRKTSHWMWYIFPQIKGLGSSLTAQKYAIVSREEARAYLEHQFSERVCRNVRGWCWRWADAVRTRSSALRMTSNSDRA